MNVNYDVGKIIVIYARAILALVCAFSGSGALRGELYTDTVSTNAVTAFTSSDTVSITTSSSTSSTRGIDVVGGATMTVSGGLIDIHKNSAFGINVAGTLLMTGGTIGLWNTNDTGISIGNNFNASLSNVLITGSSPGVTGINVYLGNLAINNTQIALQGSNVTGISIGSRTSRVIDMGANNIITMSGSDNWALKFVASGATNIVFDGTLRYLPVMSVSGVGGGLVQATSANITFKTANGSLSNSSLTASGGVGVQVTTGTVVFDGANTGGYKIAVDESLLKFIGAADAMNSDIQSGTGSVIDFTGISGAGLNVGILHGSGTVTMGAKNLTTTNVNSANATFGGSFVGTGNITKDGSGAWQFGGIATEQSQNFNGNLNLNAGTLRLLGSGLFSTTGTFAQKASSELAFWANKSGLAVDNVDIAAGSIFDIAGLTGLSSGVSTSVPNAIKLVSSTNGGLGAGQYSYLRAGDTDITLSGTDSFMYYDLDYRNGGKELWLNNISMAWSNPAINNAHGVFNVTKYYNLDYILADHSGAGGANIYGWDGRSLVKNGNGQLILHQKNTYTGTTMVNDGILALGANDSIASSSQVILNGNSELHLGDHNQRINNLTSTSDSTYVLFSLYPANTVDFSNDRDTTFAGKITTYTAGVSSALVVKSGTGKLTLSQATFYKGKTWVKEGDLYLSAAGAISNSSEVVVDGTLNNGLNQIYNNLSGSATGRILIGGNVVAKQAAGFTGTFAGVFDNRLAAGLLAKQGAGTLVLTGNNINTGLTRIDEGTLALAGGGSLSQSESITMSVASGGVGVFDISQSSGAQNIKTLQGGQTGNSTVRLGNNDLNLTAASGTFGGVIAGAGGMNINPGSNTYVLTGSNSYTGRTTLNTGTLKVGDGGATGSIESDVLNNSALVFDRGNASRYSGNISGAGTVTKLGAGTLTLTGSNTHTGLTTINAGSLYLGDGGASGSIEGNILIGNGGLLGINRSDNYIYNGLISNGGPSSKLTKDGTGAFTLTGAASAVGMVNVASGTLRFAQNGGFSAATYTTAAAAVTSLSGSSILNLGSFNQNADSTLDLTLGSTTPIIQTSNATLSGTLKISGFTAALSGSASGLASTRTTIIRSTNNIIGDFTAKTADAVATGVDYIALTYGVSTSLKDYEIGYDLAWRDTDLAAASGNFTIASGTGFLVDAVLADRTGVTSGWDGMSLVKAGSGTLTLAAVNTYSGTTNLQAGELVLANNAALGSSTLAFTGASKVNAGIANLALANAVTLATSVTGTVDTAAHAATLNGNISGAGSLAKIGTGTLAISASNSYSGNTNIAAGTVIASNADALGGGTVNIASAARAEFTFNSGTLDNRLTGAGEAVIRGTSVRIDALNTDFSGTWTLASGASALVNDTADLGAATVNLTGTLTADGAANYTFTNTLTGAGNIVFAGTGINTLGSSVGNVFTGKATAAAGTFRWDANASAALANATLSADSGITSVATGSQSAQTLIANGGTFAFTGTAHVADFSAVSGKVLFDTAVLNQGTLLTQDEATINTLIASANAWTGALANLGLIDAGGATLGATSTLTLQDGAAKGIFANTLARVGNALTLNYQLAELQLQLGRTGTLSGDTTPAAAADMKAAITGAGSLEIAANNLITLVGQKTYTGTTFITSGTLQGDVANVIATSTAVVNDATFALNGNNQTLNNLSGAATGHILLDVANIAINNDSNTTFLGDITGSGGVSKNGVGTLTLGGTNRYLGSTTINAGILRATNVDALGGVTNAGSTVSLAATGTLDFDLTSANTGNYGGMLTGDGLLLKNDNGKLIMSGNSGAWNGSASVNAGTLAITGNFGSTGTTTVNSGGALTGTGTMHNVVIADGGRLAPGASPGQLNIVGGLTLQNGAILDYELGAITNPGHIYQSGTNDRILVTGDVTLLGVSTLNVAPTVAALARGEYDLIGYTGALLGTGSITLGAINGHTATGFSIDTADNTGATKWIKLLYGLGTGYNHWDGGNSGHWTTVGIDGGSGNWYAPGIDATYTAWTGSLGALPNGEWANAEFAIFGGLNSGTVTVVNSGTAIALSGAQFKIDGYLITGGTLTTGGTFANVTLNTGNLGVATTATIATTITGTHGVEKAGLGTLVLTGSNKYEGPTDIREGTLVMTDVAALGVNSATIATDATLRVATASTTFSNTLNGTGLFNVNLANVTDTFAFSNAATGSAFTGTAVFNTGTYALNNNALVNATAILGAGNSTVVATGTQRIGKLTSDGGSITFTYATGTQANGIIKTGNLDAISGNIVTVNNAPATGTTGLVAAPLLQQDEGRRILLIDASAVSLTNTNFTLAGGATTTANIRNASSVTTATATYAQTLDYARGLSVNYELTQLALVASQTTTLSDDQTPASAAELHAQITGSGNLAIRATNTITLNNSANTYTGTTTVSAGTLRSGTHNALGETSRLDIRAGAATDLAGMYQKIGYVTSATNTSLVLGGGTLAGTNATATWSLNGLVDARGAGARLDAGNSNLIIGNSGTTARLLVDGGIVTTGSIFDIGYNTNNTGRAEVSGSGFLNTPSTFRVGFFGNGFLDLSDSGSASAFAGILGSGGSGKAQVTLRDTSLINFSSNLILGQSSGTGTLTIADNARVNVVGRSDIGTGASLGTVTVSGSGFWKNGSLAVGNGGRGILNIIDSGSVQSGGGYIGYSYAGSSSVTVSDNGYFQTTSLIVTQLAADQATLTVEDNARFIATNVQMNLGRGRINLLGGLMQVTTIASNTGGLHTFTIDTGTLQAGTHTASFISGFTASNTIAITSGGAFIDSGSYNVGIAADSAITGAGALTKLGTGVLTLSASSNYQGGTHINAGTLIMTNTAAIGTGTANIATGAELRVMAAGNTLFGNSVKGTGLFNVMLDSSASTFGISALPTFSLFSGTVQLTRGTYNLFDATPNEAALANATLRTQAGSIINLGTNSASSAMKIHDLELIGGTINVQMKTADSAHILEVDTLKVAGATAVTFNLDTATLRPGAPTAGNFLVQDSGTNSMLLVKAATLDIAGKQMGILIGGVAPSASGTTIVVSDGHNTDIKATYNYAAFSNTAAYSDTQSSVSGIYADYLLTELETQTDLILDNTGAADTTLSALIKGAGNLEIIGNGAQITLSHSNSHTGTTTVTSGTGISAATDAFGHTTQLNIASPAALDLAGHAQQATTLANAGLLNLNSGTLTLANGGASTGAITGAGQLNTAGKLTVTGSNATSINVYNTGTIELYDVAGLGNTGTITSSGLVYFDDASGTFAKTLTGAGNASLTGTSQITLSAANTISGTWVISNAANTLTASSTANLGTAAIANSGTFIMANAADELLGNALSGTGAFVKQNTGNLAIAQANNAFTGATLISSGTLTLQNLLGTGTGNLINNAALDLAAGGIFSNNITGTGTTNVSHGAYGSYVVLSGNNQTDWHITGGAQVASRHNLGTGSTRIDGILAINSGSAWTYTNTLTGTGTLAVTLDSATNAFAFQPASVGNTFAGTVELHDSTFHLADENTRVLTHATLQVDTGNITNTGSGVQHIGNLTLASGTIAFALANTGTHANGIIRTDALNVQNTTIVIDTTKLAGNTLPLLQQDERHAIALVESTTLAPRSRTLITGANLRDHTGAQITDATALAIVQGSTPDTVATGTYDFAAVASNTGLHLGYHLTALDLHAGKTTTLDQDIDNTILRGAHELHATINGSGNLRIDATQAITLNATNTYTGTTFVNSGTLISGANEALGQTRQLLVETPATFDLNGKTQTIANGGRIDGHIIGSGALSLSGGTLTVTTANTGYRAQTAINSAATAHIKNTAALGTAALALNGTLTIDTTGAGALQNTLTGTGLFNKINTGTITLAHSNPAFAGSATLAAGRLIAQKIDSLSAATINIATPATYDLRASGTLLNTLRGSGTFAITAAHVHVDRANAIANTLTLTLDNAAQLWLEKTGVHLGTLHMNTTGTLGFMQPLDTARITNLGNSAGSFVMNVNLAAARTGLNPAGTVANHLTIDNAGAGTHNVFIKENGLPTANNLAIEIITTATGTANFVLANNPQGKLEYDLTTFELLQGDGSGYTPLTNKWYLTDRSLSHSADAIINTASTLALDWNYSLDSLHLRMGDIRAENLAKASIDGANASAEKSASSTGNLWMRSRGYRLNATNALSGMSFKQYGWGVTAGADKAFASEQGVNLIGGFIDMGGVNRDFDNHGTGQTHNIGIGAYATILNNNGWFTDIVAKADRFSNEFEAKSFDGKTTRGKYTAKGQGLSIETGKRLQRTDGWWVEPAVQASVFMLNGATYHTQATAVTRSLKVEIDDSLNYQYRAQVRFGRQFRDSAWHPYGKFAAVAVDTDGSSIKAHGKTFETDYDGKRVEFGFGTSYKINATSQVYFDYEYAKASYYERPWSLNLGYRRLW